MSEIADLTFNVVAFTEVMGMIWKRLNDSGKNWRHVYKVNIHLFVLALETNCFLYDIYNIQLLVFLHSLNILFLCIL